MKIVLENNFKHHSNEEITLSSLRRLFKQNVSSMIGAFVVPSDPTAH